MAIFLLILGLLILGGAGFYLAHRLHGFVSDRLTVSLSKKEWAIYAGLCVAFGVGFLLTMLSIFFFNPTWESVTSYASGLFAGESISYPSNLASVIVGSLFFGTFFAGLWSAFYVIFWKSKLEARDKKAFRYILYGSIPLSLACFLCFTSGIAPYLSYPLTSGFHFGQSAGWDYTYSGRDDGNLHIAWYGLIILSGVCVSYFVCDHAFYKEFHKHGILDTVVLIAFPAGVLGARIWYVVGNWSREFAGRSFSHVFMIWDGGLTILGGAFAGILAGYLFLKFRRKYVDIRWALDITVPSILLAQAIGRWGNFFNVEVYGKEVALSQGWAWLPNWIALQMNCVNHSQSILAPGMINAPLFLVESLLSIAGYFVITYGVGKGLKKFIVKGDLAGCYFLWYGLVRIIMEPMRNEDFNMGTDNAWSIANSIVYILLGVGVISCLHLHDYLLKEKARPDFASANILVMALPSLAFPAIRSLTASNSSNAGIAVYQGFEVLFQHSPALLTAYIFLCLGTLAMLSSYVSSLLNRAKAARYSMIGGIGFLAVGGAMFLLGKDWTNLGTTLTIDGTSYYNVVYSLSYGFVLSALFAFLSAALAGSVLWSEHDKKKALEVASHV